MPIPIASNPSTVSSTRRSAARQVEQAERLTVVPWKDPIADPHGVQPNSRYVELYWLGILGPSTTWLLRRLSYGLDIHHEGFELDMPETARALGLGDRMGKNAPFRRALQRLCTFELARPHGPGAIAVRTRIPPLPLRHLSRLPDSLQISHRTWLAQRHMGEPELMKRRARQLAKGLALEGRRRVDVERQLGAWHFHPAAAFAAVEEVFGAGDPGTALFSDTTVDPLRPGTTSPDHLFTSPMPSIGTSAVPRRLSPARPPGRPA